MTFIKSKKTFGEATGRMGMPMARKPIIKPSGKRQGLTNGARMGRKTRRKALKGAAGAAPMARKPRTGKLKGRINSQRMSKQPPMPARGRKDQRTGNFYMSKRPQGGNPTQDSIDARLGSYFSGIKGGF